MNNSCPKSFPSSFKILALASLTILAASGCSKKEVREKTREEKAETCRGMIDVSRFPELALTKIIDGKEGYYRLTDSRVFVVTKEEGKISYFAGKTKIDKKAEVELPEASKPTLKTDNSVTCFDTQDIADSQIEGSTEAPLVVSREDGKMPVDLRFIVKTAFVQHGEKAEVAQKSVSGAEVATSEADTNVLTPTEGGPVRKFFRVSPTGFAVRDEETVGTSRKISVSIYQLTPKTAPKATPAPTPAPTPEPTPAVSPTPTEPVATPAS